MCHAIYFGLLAARTKWKQQPPKRNRPLHVEGLFTTKWRPQLRTATTARMTMTMTMKTTMMTTTMRTIPARKWRQWQWRQSTTMTTTAAAPRRRRRGDGEEVVQQDSLLSRYIFRVALHEEGNYVFFSTPILNAKLVLKSSQQLRIPSAKKLRDLAQISEDGILSWFFRNS